MNFNFIEMLILVIVLFMFSSNLKLEGQVKSLKASLNQILKHMDLPDYPVTEEIKTLVANNEEIKAIKKARELYGFSLVEGKEYIEALKEEGKE